MGGGGGGCVGSPLCGGSVDRRRAEEPLLLYLVLNMKNPVQTR